MSYWYLATPYTEYPDGVEEASTIACREAGRLLDAGILVFSPIAHFHAIASAIGYRPHGFWMTADVPFMHAATGLIVLHAESWNTSKGIYIEREFFRARRLPIVEMMPGHIPELLIPETGMQ